eukprot:2587037-Pyramimonas_sp.AAC.1
MGVAQVIVYMVSLFMGYPARQRNCELVCTRIARKFACPCAGNRVHSELAVVLVLVAVAIEAVVS